jgi:hypothetical protein
MTFAPVTHEEVRAAITAWLATQPRSLSPVERRFIDDIYEERNTDNWARFRAEDVIALQYVRPRVLLAVRSAAVLLPILLTWLALSQVVDPFARYVQNVDSSANFLWFWQTNPNNAFAGPWTLSHVALIDAGLLAFMVIVSVRISWHETSIVERREDEYDQLMRMLNAYLATASSRSGTSHHCNADHNKNCTAYANDGQGLI